MSARTTTQRAILVALAMAAALSGGLALTASPALAMKYRSLPSAEFGTAGSGNGQIEQAMGLAIDDSTGDVYVADTGNNRVEKFDAKGNYISQLTGAETPAKSFAGVYNVAVDNSCALHKLTGSECTKTFPLSGDVYVVDREHKVVDAFDPSGKYLSQITGSSPSTPFGPILQSVAVDPEGNIWVAELLKILVFGSTGEFFGSFEVGEYICEKSLGTDSRDDVYAVGCNGGLVKFGPAGEILSFSVGGPLARSSGVAVNMATNHVLSVASGGIQEFGPFGEPYGTIIQQVESAGNAIAVNDSTELLYAASGHNVSIFEESIPAKVLSSQVAEPRRTSAVVLSHIDPEGGTIRYRIDYGETSNYGQHTFEPEIKASNNEQVAELGIEGLAPGRVYHYSLQVTNPAGTITTPDATFTTAAATPPTATTGGASNLALTTAAVSGTIDPEGLETSYEFDLGTDTTYGTSIYGEAGASAEPIELSVPLQNLAPSATYHYRIVAINSDGRTYGADRTFTTPAYSAPIVLPSALPLIQAPSIAFPTETGSSTHVTAKSLTNEQKLANALKACKKKPKRRRATCERQARAKYHVVKRAKKKA
jgi:hypothetical protein